MNKSQFITFIKNPNSFEDKDLKVLSSLTESFPYCQISHIIQAKATHDTNSMLANEMLKKAAVYSTNRVQLKRIINSKAVVETKSKIVKVDTPITPLPEIIEKSVEIKTKIEKTEKKEVKVEDTAKKDITSEIEKTLKESKELKKNHSIDNSKPLNEKIDEVKEKASEKKNSIIEDEIVSGDIWNSVFSSRLGESLDSENEFSTEYPFDYRPYNFVISTPERINNSALIDEFIEKSPSISRAKSNNIKEGTQVNLADKSIKRKSAPKTETLAKLYLSQGNTKKALKIYEDLLLKVPEKRTYFATQIEKIKNKK